MRDKKAEIAKKETLSDPLLKEIFRRAGPPKTLVITTKDMSVEEKEMEVMAGFLKEGYSPEEAEAKARRFVRALESI